MTQQESQILHQTYGDVQRILGILNGGNGGGLLHDVQALETEQAKCKKAISDVQKNMVTRAVCAQQHKDERTARGKIWVHINSVLLLIIAAVTLMNTLGWIGS